MRLVVPRSKRFFPLQGFILGLAVFFHLQNSSIAAPLRTPDISSALQAVIKTKVAKKLGIEVFDLSAGTRIFQFNNTAPLKPASVLKVLTSLSALETLGPEYKFKTELWTEKSETASLGTLFVRGGGDPGLAIETALLLARKLRRLGVTHIKNLKVDDSLFAESNEPVGQRAYQTGSSALSFNYNSMAFDICPTHAGEPALIAPDPWEIGAKVEGSIKTQKRGSSSLAIDEISSEPGQLRFRASGSITEGESCKTVYRSLSDPALFFGFTFRHLLEMVNIKVGAVERGRVPSEARLLYVQDSESLSRIVQDLNHFSNNFIAEQILYALGGNNGEPWSRAKGLALLGNYLKDQGVPDSEYTLEDASGLSHKNRLSASAVVKLLVHAVHSPGVLAEFQTSLSVAGLSGTLKKRNFAGDGLILRGKTGTLDGVSALAGYVTTSSGQQFVFAILQNEVSSRDQALEFEERFVRALTQ